MNLDTGDKELVQKNTEFSGFETDDDYKVRFASKFTPDGGNLYLKPDGKGGWSDFLKVGMADSLTTRPAGFDKSGDVLYLIDSRDRDTAALTTLDLKTGETNRRAPRTPRPTWRRSGASDRKHDSSRVASTTSGRVEVLDPASRGRFRLSARPSPTATSTVTSRTLDDKQWIVAFLMDNGPVRYYRYDRTTQESDVPVHQSQGTGRAAAAEDARRGRSKSRDGLDLVSYLTLAAGNRRQGRRPARPTAADGARRPRRPVGARRLGLRRRRISCWPTAATRC